MELRFNSKNIRKLNLEEQFKKAKDPAKIATYKSPADLLDAADPRHMLEPGELGLAVTDNNALKNILERFDGGDRDDKLAQEAKSAFIGVFAGPAHEIMAEFETLKENGFYALSLFGREQNEVWPLRPLTFGDIIETEKGPMLQIRPNEAAIIVIDKTVAKRDPEANPFVSAYAGHESLILKEKKKYETKAYIYEVYYWPAESN